MLGSASARDLAALRSSLEALPDLQRLLGGCAAVAWQRLAGEIEPLPELTAELQRGLADEPRSLGCQKLSGEDKYRLRQGNYRVVYLIEDGAQAVVVFKVGHRRDVYR